MQSIPMMSCLAYEVARLFCMGWSLMLTSRLMSTGDTGGQEGFKRQMLKYTEYIEQHHPFF